MDFSEQSKAARARASQLRQLIAQEHYIHVMPRTLRELIARHQDFVAKRSAECRRLIPLEADACALFLEQYDERDQLLLLTGATDFCCRMQRLFDGFRTHLAPDVPMSYQLMNAAELLELVEDSQLHWWPYPVVGLDDHPASGASISLEKMD